MKDDFQYLKIKLKNMNSSGVSRDTGINYQTIIRIKNGTVKKPSYEVIYKLLNYFRGMGD